MQIGSCDKDVMLIVKASNFNTKGLANISLFNNKSFYKVAKLMLTEQRELYTRHFLVQHISFQLVMAVKLQVMQDP